jgi:hypothetical protein
VPETNGRLQTCIAQNGKLVSPNAAADPLLRRATAKEVRAVLTQVGPDMVYADFADHLLGLGLLCSSDNYYRQRCNLGFARPGSRKKIGQSTGKRLMQSTQTRPRVKPVQTPAPKPDLSGLRAEVRRHIAEIDQLIRELQAERSNLARYLGGSRS